MLCYLVDPIFQVVNTAGKPATGGYIEVYVHGTGDKYYCASDFDGTLHPFKIPLDSLGSNIILADDANTYDIYAYNRYGSLLMSRHNVSVSNSGGGGGEASRKGTIYKIGLWAVDAADPPPKPNEYWVLDLESPNENAPGGYDRLTVEKAREIHNSGAFFGLRTEHVQNPYEDNLLLETYYDNVPMAQTFEVKLANIQDSNKLSEYTLGNFGDYVGVSLVDERNLSLGKLHRISVRSVQAGDPSPKPQTDWIIDLESPNPNEPDGYDRLTVARAIEIHENGEEFAFSSSASNTDTYYESLFNSSPGYVHMTLIRSGFHQHPNEVSLATVDGYGDYLGISDAFQDSEYWNVTLVQEGSDELRQNKIHRYSFGDATIDGETPVYGSWLIDLDKPDPNGPEGYSRVTPYEFWKATAVNGEVPVYLQDKNSNNSLTYAYLSRADVTKSDNTMTNVFAYFVRSGYGNNLSQSMGFRFTKYPGSDYLQKASATDDLFEAFSANGVLSIANGGTNASTAADARTNLDVYSKAEVNTAIDTTVASAYHAAGTKTVAQLTNSLLVAANQGKVYNMTDSGTTTADFVDGAGHPIKAGDNVGICDVGGGVYKFDLLSGFVDLSGYKAKQTAVTDPTADGNGLSFIDSASQNANGEVTLHKKNVQDGTTSQKGVVQLEDSVSSTATDKAATPNAVKTAYDLASAKLNKDGLQFTSVLNLVKQEFIPGANTTVSTDKKSITLGTDNRDTYFGFVAAGDADVGSVVCLSFDVEYSGSDDGHFAWPFKFPGDNGAGLITITGKGHYHTAATIISGYALSKGAELRACIDDGVRGTMPSQPITIKNLKVELGEVPTGFSLAPADVAFSGSYNDLIGKPLVYWSSQYDEALVAVSDGIYNFSIAWPTGIDTTKNYILEVTALFSKDASELSQLNGDDLPFQLSLLTTGQLTLGTCAGVMTSLRATTGAYYGNTSLMTRITSSMLTGSTLYCQLAFPNNILTLADKFAFTVRLRFTEAP